MEKTIFIFRQYASSPGVPGGTRHFRLASQLVKMNFSAYIFTSNFDHFTKRNIREFKGDYVVENLSGVKFVRIRSYGYFSNNWRRVVNMMDYAIKTYETAVDMTKHGKVSHPDVIIGSVSHIFSVLAAYFASTKLRSRFFIDVGELWPEALSTTGKLSKKNPLYHIISILMSFLYRKAERIICISEDAAKYLTKKGYGTRILTVVPGIEIEESFRKVNRIKKPKEFRVIYSGSFQPIYPLHKAIEAAKVVKNLGHRDIYFLLIGDGAQRESLKCMAEKMGLSNVSFFDPLPRNGLLEFLRSGSVFLFLEKSISYGFPNKLLDYLYVGRPIIYASPVQNKKLINSGCCIESSYEDPGSIADAILEIASMEDDKWKRMCERAQKYLQENHDIVKVSKCLIDAI